MGKWLAKFRTVKFVPELFAFIMQISSTCQKRLQRRETGMKDDLVEMEHEFPLVHMHSVREKRNTFLDVTLKKVTDHRKG